MKKITDEEAETLIDSFKNGDTIVDQDGRGDGKVISIKDGLCTVEFENGEIGKYENSYFYESIIRKV